MYKSDASYVSYMAVIYYYIRRVPSTSFTTFHFLIESLLCLSQSIKIRIRFFLKLEFIFGWFKFFLMKKLFLIFSVVMLSSCYTKQEHQEMLQSWVGHDKAKIIDVWGPPTSYYEADGAKYLTWSNSSGVMPSKAYNTYGYETATTPLYITQTGGDESTPSGTMSAPDPLAFSPSMPTKLYCDTTMMVTDGLVVSVTSKGNNCYISAPVPNPIADF